MEKHKLGNTLITLAWNLRAKRWLETKYDLHLHEVLVKLQRPTIIDSLNWLYAFAYGGKTDISLDEFITLCEDNEHQVDELASVTNKLLLAAAPKQSTLDEGNVQSQLKEKE